MTEFDVPSSGGEGQGFGSDTPDNDASGTSLAWETVTVPTAAADWDTDNAVGTWTFTAGVIAQTDDTADGSSIIATKDDVFGLAFDVQCDLRRDSDGGNGAYGLFAAGLFDQSLTANVFAAAGVDSNANADGIAMSDSGGGGLGTPAIGAWHTYRIVVNGYVAFLYYDGVLINWGMVPTHNNWAEPAISRLALTRIAGAVSFRNFVVKRIPVPA